MKTVLFALTLSAMSAQAFAGSNFTNPFASTAITIACTQNGTSQEPLNIFWKPAGISQASGPFADKLSDAGIVVEADWNAQEISIENLAMGTGQILRGHNLMTPFKITAGADAYSCLIVSTASVAVDLPSNVHSLQCATADGQNDIAMTRNNFGGLTLEQVLPTYAILSRNLIEKGSLLEGPTEDGKSTMTFDLATHSLLVDGVVRFSQMKCIAIAE